MLSFARLPIALRPRGFGRRLLATTRDWCDAAVDLVFPPVCADCGVGLDGILGQRFWCEDCLSQLLVDGDLPMCSGCGLPRDPRLPAATVCAECRRRKFRFDRAIALGAYRGHLRQVAIRMKRFHEFPLSAAVGQLLADRCEDRWGDDLPEVIVPIPKFWVKRVLHGTNTSEVLAESLSRRWRRPLIPGALRCRKSTRKQSLLGRSERQRNVAGALQLVKRYDFDKADVLIVDDIMTTGATANEAAKVLARAGASNHRRSCGSGDARLRRTIPGGKEGGPIVVCRGCFRKVSHGAYREPNNSDGPIVLPPL